MKKYIQPQFDCVTFSANDIVTVSAGGAQGNSLIASWNDFELSE